MTPRRAAPPPTAPDPVRLIGAGFGYAGAQDVLSDVSLSLAPGSFHFLTGPSGAGKSTLLSLLTLSERPTAGRVMLFGQDTAGVDRKAAPLIRRRLGVVFQDFRLIEHLSVFDNAALPLRLSGARPETWKADVVEMLDWVGLKGRMDAPTPSLSGGEKQRLAIARAVVAGPELILADEPTGNVDHGMAERLLGLFQALNRLGVTVLIASHDGVLAERSGARRLHLEQGRLEALS